MDDVTGQVATWAAPIILRYWAEQGAIALLILARSADASGVTPVLDVPVLEEHHGLRAGWLENGMLLLEEEGLIEAGLLRPRDVATMHLVGPVRLLLDRTYDR